MNNLLTQKFPIAAFALLFVLTMSCSHEPAIEPQDPGGTNVAQWNDSTINGDAVMNKMAFYVSDGNMIVERQETTRSTTAFDGTGSFSENDLIAIAVTRSGESEVVKLYRMKNDGSLEYAGSDNAPFVWKSTSETVSIRAWSYGTDANLSYMLDAPETIEYDLETDQNTNGYQELLYCKAADKNYSTSAITLNFYHQLTRLVFNVDHELEDDLAVTSVSIGGAIPTKAQFSVPTGNGNYIGTWSIKSATGSITPHEDNTEAGYQKTYSVVIFPETYAKNSTIFTLTNSDGNYVYSISEDAGQTLVAGNQYNYTITVKNGYVENFSYVASAQTFTAPQTGTYKIECWGASGGAAVLSSSEGTAGYVSGVIMLTKNQVLYVYTGQQGKKYDNYSSTYMFNGGGYANKLSSGLCGSCGGGATDIRTTNGSWDNSTSLNSRIMVAAGGGGVRDYDTHAINGCAGGLQGYDGNPPLATYEPHQGKGGTQTAGGAIPTQYNTAQNGTAGALGKGGIGGHSMGSPETGGGSGGGGGLYGGSGASGLSNGVWFGGGGSSYISGHSGCTAKPLTFSSTVMIDGAGYQWTSTKGSRVGIPTPANGSVRQNGYVGNGFCRITRYGY